MSIERTKSLYGAVRAVFEGAVIQADFADGKSQVEGVKQYPSRKTRARFNHLARYDLAGG